MYYRCYVSRKNISLPEKGSNFNEQEESVGEGSDGAVSDGHRLLYAPENEAGWSCGVLSFSLNKRGEPASLYSKGGGGTLAQTGLCLAEVHEGDGLMGEGE